MILTFEFICDIIKKEPQTIYLGGIVLRTFTEITEDSIAVRIDCECGNSIHTDTHTGETKESHTVREYGINIRCSCGKIFSADINSNGIVVIGEKTQS